jgi:hypothetical protein
MAVITTNVPDLNIDIAVKDVTFLNHVSRVELSGNVLRCFVDNGLSDDEYNDIAKQIRIIYSFSFEHVYSEDYEVSEPTTSIGYGGNNERKQHLLDEPFTSLNDNFSITSQQIFTDLLKMTAKIPQKVHFYNLAYIWSRANELVELHLLTEAFVQYWRILDEMHAKTTTVEAKKILHQHGLDEDSTHNIFAARVLMSIDRGQRKSAAEEIPDLANLDFLRQPHAHQAGGRRKYYLEEETHLEAEIHNWFIADVTKVFILWLIGLEDYYLSPRANIYEIKKHTI